MFLLKPCLVRNACASILATLAAIVVLASPAVASSGGANNIVTASSRVDNQVSTRSALQLSYVGGDTLTSTNIADATTDACTLCEANAVAIQVVISTGSPTTVTPANVASATNLSCTSCVAYAYAYQYDVTTNGPATLSADAQQQIATLRRRAQELAATRLAPDDLAGAQTLTAELDDVASQVKAVVDANLHPVGAQAVRSVDG